jgi:hypothetical protein
VIHRNPFRRETGSPIGAVSWHVDQTSQAYGARAPRVKVAPRGGSRVCFVLVRAAVKRWVYVGGAALGVVVVGAIAYAATSSPPSPPAPPPPAPAPSPAPPGPPAPQNLPPTPPARVAIPTFQDLVDPSFVTDTQQKLATIATKGTLSGMTQGQFNLPIYTPQDVDGDPNNTKFVYAVSVFQGDLRSSVTATSLRTDGKLDYLTAALICFIAIDLFGYQQTFGVTGPALIGMAQQALSNQNKVKLPQSFPVDGTMNPGFVAGLVAWQQGIAAEKGSLSQMRTDGQFDWLTLATLLIQAYGMR